jgi:hypothetical protein
MGSLLIFPFTRWVGFPAVFVRWTVTYSTFRTQLVIQNAASILGRTLPNLLADKIGPLNVSIFVSFGTGVMVFALFGVTDLSGVIVFAILYGFFSGGSQYILGPHIY